MCSDLMQNYELTAKVFKAFDDEKRLFIIEMIKNGEICACEILENMKISQPTLSHHMKILCDSGIVNARKEGKWTYYSINNSGIQKAINLLKLIISNDSDEKDSCT